MEGNRCARSTAWPHFIRCGWPSSRPAVTNNSIDELAASEWYEKGYSFWAVNYEDAIVAFSKAIELNPRYAEAFKNRGLAYAILGNRSQAIADLKIAAKLGDK